MIAVLRAFAATHSKVIASGVGFVASFIAVQVWGHDLDTQVKGMIFFLVTTACTYLAPRNRVSA